MKMVRENKIDYIADTHETLPLPVKVSRGPLRTSKRVAAKEICDSVILQTKERFQFTNHLLAANLFQAENFGSFEKQFPHSLLNQACIAYPFLDKPKLRTELEILYMRNDFRTVSGATTLLQFLLENKLQSVFGESIKLLDIVITIRMTTSEAERCFSTLKRIKTFLRSTMNEDRLNALAMLSIEKDLVRDSVDFNEAVIDKFASLKERRMDFLYKLSA